MAVATSDAWPVIASFDDVAVAELLAIAQEMKRGLRRGGRRLQAEPGGYGPLARAFCAGTRRSRRGDRKEPTEQNDKHLSCGEGQREQYGEGHRYRPEDLTKAADQSSQSDWAGGDDEGQKAAASDRDNGDDRRDKTVPKT